MGSLSRAVTYDRDERGIAYGARALWRHRPRSSRESNASSGRTGRPSTGRRGPGDWIFNNREARVMQNAETVLGVLRERGRRGLPCDELYRQLFNPHLFLLAHGRIYANHGAMTPGACGETADGMSLAKIGRIIDALRHERYRFQPPHPRNSHWRATCRETGPRGSDRGSLEKDLSLRQAPRQRPTGVGKLRGKQLVEKPGRTRRYHVPP